MHPTIENPGNRLRRPFLTDWTTSDLVALMTTSLFALMAWMIGQSLMAILVALLLLALNLRVEWGRLYAELGVRLVIDPYIRLVLRDTLYRADESDGRVRQFLRERRYLPQAFRQVMPLEVGEICLPSADGLQQSIGVIRPTDYGDVHVVIRGRGSNAMSGGPASSVAFVDTLARAIDGAASMVDGSVGIATGRMSRPVNLSVNDLYMVRNASALYFADPCDLDNKTEGVAERIRQFYEALMQTQRDSGVADVWRYVVVTLKWTQEVEDAMLGKLDERRVRNLPIVQLSELMVDALTRAGVIDAVMMSGGELCEMVRASWDVADLQFHGARIDPNHTYSLYPEREVVVGSNFIRFDGRSWLSTIRIGGKPAQLDVEAVQELLHSRAVAPGTWTSTATVGKVMSAEAVAKQTVFRRAVRANVRGAFGGRRVVEDPASVRADQEQSAATWAMSGASAARCYGEYVCVAAATREEMERGRQAVMGNLRAAGFSPTVVTGRARQMRAYLTATLGLNML